VPFGEYALARNGTEAVPYNRDSQRHTTRSLRQSTKQSEKPEDFRPRAFRVVASSFRRPRHFSEAMLGAEE
jgi:hypothetical protein